MKTRLLQLMESESMTPAKFADEIGVQRSSISHILSERNKPSYDFILKILERFPQLNPEWLITGKGNMNKVNFDTKNDSKQTSLFDFKSESVQKSTENTKIEQQKSIESQTDKKDIPGNINELKNSLDPKNIDKFTNVNNIKFLIIAYNDGTFERFTSR